MWKGRIRERRKGGVKGGSGTTVAEETEVLKVTENQNVCVSERERGWGRREHFRYFIGVRLFPSSATHLSQQTFRAFAFY